MTTVAPAMGQPEPSSMAAISSSPAAGLGSTITLAWQLMVPTLARTA